ncbi:MAG: hypothetical protein R3Y09_12835 [Clostridia bacterium]
MKKQGKPRRKIENRFLKGLNDYIRKGDIDIKGYSKIALAGTQMLVAFVLVGTVTFAWFTSSISPEVKSVKINIAGSSTIMVASNVSKTIDGVTYNYPAEFGDELKISSQDEYSYLSNLDALLPVSTADGINWFLPVYYDPAESEVQQGLVKSGDLKPVEEFFVDSTLQYANHKNLPDYDTVVGNYAYLDFWVTSPMDYDLRVSMDVNDPSSNGSFALDLLTANEVDQDGDGIFETYELESNQQSTAAIRVGYLVNDTVSLLDYDAYKTSSYFDDRYEFISGIYQQAGQVADGEYNFTIYEPNADYHPEIIINQSGAQVESTLENGSYVITNPIGFIETDDGVEIGYVDVSENLAVQLTNSWINMELLQSLFSESIKGENSVNMTASELVSQFFQEHLLGKYSEYITKGEFIKDTSKLYELADAETQTVSKENIGYAEQAGVTENAVIVSLQANVPQRIRMYIWLEGQDIDCENNIIASNLVLSVELAGGSE